MSFLRKVFGLSKAEIWQQLCNEIGAEFIQGGIWKGNKVVARVKEWTITLDTYSQTTSTGQTTTSTTYTRLRAPYVNQDGFRMNYSDLLAPKSEFPTSEPESSRF
jgi:hypothetical protein